jgi:histidinol dehydrogenase
LLLGLEAKRFQVHLPDRLHHRTSDTARFANGLCAMDFPKRSSVISYSREALAAAADDIRCMATEEGLTAPSASAGIRFEDRRTLGSFQATVTTPENGLRREPAAHFHAAIV